MIAIFLLTKPKSSRAVPSSRILFLKSLKEIFFKVLLFLSFTVKAVFYPKLEVDISISSLKSFAFFSS